MTCANSLKKVVSHPVCQSSTCVAAQSKSLFHVLKRAFPHDDKAFSAQQKRLFRVSSKRCFAVVRCNILMLNVLCVWFKIRSCKADRLITVVRKHFSATSGCSFSRIIYPYYVSGRLSSVSGKQPHLRLCNPK